MSDGRDAVAARLGIKKTEDGHELDHRSLLTTMGGVQGILESVAPGFLFVFIFAIWRSSVAAVIASALASLVFIAIRLTKKQSALNAVVGIAGIALAAFLALREGGSGRDYFIPGFITNAAYLAVLLLSVLVRLPIFGLILGFVLGEGISWRKNRYELRIFTAATLIAAAVFAIRLVVELPLYYSNQLEPLAIAKLVLGLPLYGTALWLDWLLIRVLFSRRKADSQ